MKTFIVRLTASASHWIRYEILLDGAIVAEGTYHGQPITLIY